MIGKKLISRHKYSKELSIREVGNFFNFLTPPPHVGSLFKPIRPQILTNFDPSQLPTSFMDGPKAV